MDLPDQIAVLQAELQHERNEKQILAIAYANCVNDHKRLRAEFANLETLLADLSNNLLQAAGHLREKRIDNPGTHGSGR